MNHQRKSDIELIVFRLFFALLIAVVIDCLACCYGIHYVHMLSATIKARSEPPDLQYPHFVIHDEHGDGNLIIGWTASPSRIQQYRNQAIVQEWFVEKNRIELQEKGFIIPMMDYLKKIEWDHPVLIYLPQFWYTRGKLTPNGTVTIIDGDGYPVYKTLFVKVTDQFSFVKTIPYSDFMPTPQELTWWLHHLPKEWPNGWIYHMKEKLDTLIHCYKQNIYVGNADAVSGRLWGIKWWFIYLWSSSLLSPNDYREITSLGEPPFLPDNIQNSYDCSRNVF